VYGLQAKTKKNFALADIMSRTRKKGILNCSKLANLIGFLMVKKELGLGINIEVEKKFCFADHSKENDHSKVKNQSSCGTKKWLG
jgi:hypothetical protein